MSNPLKIKVTGDNYVYGDLDGNKDNPLVIFVHGFMGSMDESKYINGAIYFNEQGFSSFRFNLYDDKSDSPKLDVSKLSNEALDLDLVVKYFQKEGYIKIFVVGHSFGGLVVLLSKSQNFKAAVLWDTAVDTKLSKDDFNSMKSNTNVFSEKMFEENNRLDPLSMVANTHIPIKLIWAGENKLGDLDHAFFEKAHDPKEVTTIIEANHNFNGDDVEKELFQETYKWFRSFL